MPHSKGPFTLTENSWSDTSLYDGVGRRIALLSIAYDCDEDSQAEWEKRQTADAAVMLEALNVHEQTGLTPAQLQARVAELEGALAAERESAFAAGFLCAGGETAEANAQASQFVACCAAAEACCAAAEARNA